MNVRSKRNKKWIKIGKVDGVGLHQSVVDPNLFQGRSRGSRRFIRRQFRAAGEAQARAMIQDVMQMRPPMADEEAIDIAEAFEAALGDAARGRRSREDFLCASERFMAWLQVQFPWILLWKDLTRPVLRKYLATFDGKSANTRRLAMQPIIQTAGFMAREQGMANIAERFGIGAKLQSTPPVVYLEDVVSFCDWMEANRPRLAVGAALQGFAALQMMEALRLTWDRVDLDRGLIEISGEVKNRYRNRVIPVCARVRTALERAWKRRRAGRAGVTPIRQPVVATSQGEPFSGPCCYSRQMRQAFLAWNPRIGWAPKDLRNGLPTYGVGQGFWNAVWEQYIGHAPGTVTTRHYVPRLASVSGGETAALDRQMELFRAQVLAPLDQGLVRIDASPMYKNVQDGSRVVG